METRLTQEINTVLSVFKEYWQGDILLKTKVIEDLREYKKELIETLLANNSIKQAYSLEVENGMIFKIDEFISMLRYKNYWDNSYTKFSNEIGLTSDNRYLKYNTDVVLDFPHKDCVLEGGMTKEDRTTKEVYYHKVLAKEEIDMLLSPKVLSNIQKFDEKGQSEVAEITDSDNLILKGNNLIALHLLKKRLAGKVKLIYIDPPYNTGGDSFKYNDRFNHSTWLTFIKNRLEIARELLREDGSIWLNIDDDEGHYLKVLGDEVFGRENFIANVIWQKKYSPQNDAKFFSDMHDHILVFAKNKKSLQLNLLPRTEEMNKRYKNPDKDPRGPWKPGDLVVKTYSSDYDYPITTPSGRVINPPRGRCWRTSKKRFQEMVEDNRIWFGVDGDNTPAIKRFLSDVKQGITPLTIWSYSEVSHNQEARKEILDLEVDDFNTPKPEKLLQRIIHLATNENDIVLDFFMGSATTQAVAMKMKRQFIGIEQMDYIQDVSVARLKKVIEGEQGGISKEVRWNGGGSFVYIELYELNRVYISRIQNAHSNNEIEQIVLSMKEVAFLDYRINVDRLTNEGSGFAALSLEEKKHLLIESLDANQMYLSYSEMEDAQYKIPESVKHFNYSFYRGQKDGGDKS
ncbi:site-specific DNA-methyltransferase [Sutcliffiella horikoshii]|uniref:site-specific DNA-methyltransferase n=1 Tax=Sutcliffiella horikoshii TaxID=79883 RepID=UPI00203AEDB3|nr:site-specific DNA-methyltransferase [Sutcliffiella horikoshii]MCM3619826.1 site-specific DNA-methyltransferase [Sutcliffiella horikoshii]